MEDQRKKEILEVSKTIYRLAETGSTEYKSSSFLAEQFRKHGFTVIYPYLGMDTAFRAECMKGGPTVGILAEYDALPNGHSCGHNLISAWAFGTAVNICEKLRCSVVVFGTPSEEGIGKYAGSKAVFARSGAFNGIDFVIGMHPDDRWAVGAKALSDITTEIIFNGRSSHLLSPEYGINALAPLIESYVAVNSIKNSMAPNCFTVVGMIIKEGGKASNVIPDRAVMEIDIRAKKSDCLNSLRERIMHAVRSIAEAYGSAVDIRDTTPLYEEYRSNRVIDRIMEEECHNEGLSVVNIDETSEDPMGSTDEANVSQVVPTGHIDMKIVEPGIPAHTDAFREAANPDLAGANLIRAVDIAFRSVERIISSKKLIADIKEEFRR